MKTSLSIACGASLLLFSFALPGDQVRFAVKEKTKLSKVFDDKTVLHSTSFSMTVDGQDAGGGMDFKLTFDERTHVEVTDEYGALRKGRPVQLTRTFDKLGGSSAQKFEGPEGMAEDGDANEEKERASELEGKTVVFKLDEAGEEYKVEFPDGKGDEKLLEDVKEDMDLRGFLPSGEVAEDKSWEIEVGVFNGVLGTPGGDLKIKTKDDQEEKPEFEKQFEDNLKGKGKGTYKGKRDVDGHHCAVIALEAELKTQAQDEESGEGGHSGVKTIGLEYVVEGELLWDVEEGHFHRCTLSSKVKMTMKDAMSLQTEDGKHEMEQVIEFEGDSEMTASIGD